MIGSIGIDLVEVARIKRLAENYEERFVERILGPREMEQLAIRHDRFQFLAGRFAAKEAVIKALGKYITDRPPLNTIQIINDITGQPTLKLSEELTQHLNHISANISISHEKSHAIAMVVFWENS
jgi:holo-[acyl-carrier protein] synthase